MAVRTIVEAAEFCEAALLAAGIDIKHYVGWKDLARNVSAPRYIWAPLQDVAEKQKPRGSPTGVWTFGEQVAIHCHGRDADQAYVMRNNVLRAVTRYAGQASMSLLTSGWREDKDGAQALQGAVYVLNVQLNVPVDDEDELGESVELEGMEHEGAMGFPSGDETVC